MKSFFKQKNKHNRGLARRPMAEGFTRTPKFGVTPKGGGFTLVETLVAISIFTISILAVLVVLTQGINNDNYAKKKILASYLAQEGIEYIRNMRDTFVLYDSDPINPSQHGWDAFKSKVAGASGSTICAQTNGYGCYFGDLAPGSFTDDTQPITDILVEPCGGACPPLLYDASTGKYGYSGVNSGFVRKIEIVPASANEIRVLSTVSWTQNSGKFSITFSENLFNWIE